MPNKYCLDTNIIIYCIKQIQPALDNVTFFDQKSLCTTVINQAELLYGAYNSARIESNLEMAKGWISGLGMYYFDDKSANTFGYLKAILKNSGQKIDDIDLMIAAICLANDLVLVTNNTKHFKRIKDLKVEDWSK